jgi:hypothetical protein
MSFLLIFINALILFMGACATLMECPCMEGCFQSSTEENLQALEENLKTTVDKVEDGEIEMVIF